MNFSRWHVIASGHIAEATKGLEQWGFLDTQASAENLSLLSHDRKLSLYGDLVVLV